MKAGLEVQISDKELVIEQSQSTIQKCNVDAKYSFYCSKLQQLLL